MKKTKLAGENISLKTRKTEDPLVMAWLNAQTNLMDSLRYLVENEIMQHGVRNLQMFIPMERAGIQGQGQGQGHAAAFSSPVAATAEEVGQAPEAEEVAEFVGDAGAADHEDGFSDNQDEVDDEDIEAWS
ncbi:hypothetical protein A8990_12583 [Paenibacillus taihuensis]|uniref:Uncharacterized protein n=1 Tax=Paenibacillus taihuensis TaxID=1156355 RepID=A0A3D9RI96_9BACL|nr:hypothetical protein [Paenibacillus taihuensis]REE78686.1 hypothetical protein A8990_12583 [Paenibacillus taihuensis]